MNDRDKRLREFVTEINAKSLFITKKGETTLEMLSANGKTFIVVKFGNGDGWDIYCPASESNNIETTFTKTRNYLKVKGE